MTASSPAVLTPPRSAARWAGLGYLAIFVLAVFANFFAIGAVYDPDDASATLDGVATSAGLLRMGILAFLAVFLIDVLIAWALYVLFRPVRRDLALLTAWSRLVHTVFLGVGLVFAFGALVLVEQDAPGQASAGDVQLAMRLFDMTWLIGLAAFGVHLILLARLLWTSAGGPRWIAAVLTVAGAAYIVDTIAHIALADYASYADIFLPVVAVPSVVGELALTVWLLAVARGRRPVPTAGRGESPAKAQITDFADCAH
ncbi:DUF4386 domain-containing protein [Gordonia rhizosphera]|uniref:DUF4386 domain-containing protein n=1 Tax=Gordonia rhizosphera NBRC 16068 TaxID=1108045 RepID=K6WWB0_9ACTN|nr:DUF4386 domain-containing protein [Gordonia rhizosphera]GAB90814.1 hypothetical protein GORHZ_118_00300 [Gordonia rhizosphera NBRC 16068]